MKQPYLEVTFRRGRPLAAYHYLPRSSGAKSDHTRQVDPGLVVDFGQDGRAIGIEITAPGKVTVEALNRLLVELGIPGLAEGDLAPLRAA